MEFSLDIEIAEHNLQTVELSKQNVLPILNEIGNTYSYFSDIEQLNNCIKNFNTPSCNTKSEMLIYHII